MKHHDGYWPRVALSVAVSTNVFGLLLATLSGAPELLLLHRDEPAPTRGPSALKIGDGEIHLADEGIIQSDFLQVLGLSCL
jgi:hypothetical protein